ncbi:DNA glycosylase [Trichoderma austrokoningii]
MPILHHLRMKSLRYSKSLAIAYRPLTTPSFSTYSHAAMAATRRSARLSSKTSAQEADEATKAAAAAAAPPPKENKRKRKAVPNAEEPPEPKTPTKKQRPVAPPLTPSTSAVGLNGGDKVATRKSVTRLADPRFSNATLLSPQTSRIVASRNAEPESPSKAASIGGKAAATTTATLLREACDHLISVDERMKPLIEKHYCHVFSPEGLAEKVDPFESLVSSIISQQVSGAAARSIKAKFIALFFPKDDDEASQPTHYEAAVEKFPAPSDVAACSIEKLRTAGLSQRKAEYVQGLAEKFASGEITAQMLHDAPDEELMEKLVAVRGLGKWTVEMFAFFALKRMNVFSLGDLGIQRGMAAFVGRDVGKLKSKGGKWKYMSEQDMVELSDKFRPYRSLFMWYMWKVEEVDVSTMG